MKMGRLGSDDAENDFRELRWSLVPYSHRAAACFTELPVDGAEILSMFLR